MHSLDAVGVGVGVGEGEKEGEGEGEGHTASLAMFFSSPAHFLKIWRDCPECSIPGVANTT